MSSLFLRAAPASSLELAGAGGRPAAITARSPRRVAPLPQPTPRPVLTAVKPQRSNSQSAPDSVQAFAAVADVLHTVLDGTTSSEGFAQVLVQHSADLDWLTTFASAVRELGKLIELGALGQVERQKTLVLVAAHAAEARQRALEASESERDALRKTAAKLAAEVDSLREQLAFHAQFSPPPEVPPPAAKPALAMQDLKLRNMLYDYERLKAEATRDKADVAEMTLRIGEVHAACSKCPGSQQPMRPPTAPGAHRCAKGHLLGPTGAPSPLGCRGEAGGGALVAAPAQGGCPCPRCLPLPKVADLSLHVAIQVQAEEKARGKQKLAAQAVSHERLVARLQEQRLEEQRRHVTVM